MHAKYTDNAQAQSSLCSTLIETFAFPPLLVKLSLVSAEAALVSVVLDFFFDFVVFDLLAGFFTFGLTIFF